MSHISFLHGMRYDSLQPYFYSSILQTSTIIGIFNQVHTGDEVVRERAIRLIHTKMKTSTAELLNKESQAELIAQIKKVFASGSVTAEEFPKLLSILQMTFLPKSTTGQAELVNMITKMADLDQESEAGSWRIFDMEPTSSGPTPNYNGHL